MCPTRLCKNDGLGSSAERSQTNVFVTFVELTNSETDKAYCISQSVNSTWARPCPRPPFPGWPPGISISFALDGKFPGVGTLELSNPLGWGKKIGQMPHPPSTMQHFSLIARSNSAILIILMCDFLFQLTSSFVIALGFLLRLHATMTCTILWCPRLEIISGEPSDTMTGQIHFNSVTYRFWPVKFMR